MQHGLRLTFAELSGSSLSGAQRLEIPNLQSIPSSRAITLRNLKAPDLSAGSGQPTVARMLRTRKAQVAVAAAATVLLMLSGWWLARRPAPFPANASSLDPGGSGSGVRSAVPASSPVPVSGGRAGGEGARENVEAPEPKAVRLDDLPREIPTGTRRKAAPTRR
jgi:hypothetical protein